MVGLGLFAASSLFCGLAMSAGVLVAARAFRGLGAALVVPSALALLTTLFPSGVERRRAVAIWTAVAALGGAAGFTLGGLLTASLGWRAIIPAPYPEIRENTPNGVPDLHREALRMFRMMGARRLLAVSLAGLAGVSGAMRKPMRAAHLFGAAEALLESIGAALDVPQQEYVEQDMAMASAQLSAEAWVKSTSDGRVVSLEEAVDYALEES